MYLFAAFASMFIYRRWIYERSAAFVRLGRTVMMPRSAVRRASLKTGVFPRPPPAPANLQRQILLLSTLWGGSFCCRVEIERFRVIEQGRKQPGQEGGLRNTARNSELGTTPLAASMPNNAPETRQRNIAPVGLTAPPCARSFTRCEHITHLGGGSHHRLGCRSFSP